MKFINSEAYSEILNRVRTPMVNVKSLLQRELGEDNKELLQRVDKYLDNLEIFLSEISGYDGWEITEDSDCWSSGGSPDLKQHTSVKKGMENSKKGNE